MTRARLLLADDHAVLAEGVRKLLEEEYDVIGIAKDGRELIAEAERLEPDVIVVDIGMPLLNGIEATRRIRQRTTVAKIVILTQQANRAYIREAFRAGANAYVLKQAAASGLLFAIREVLEGRYYVSPEIETPELARGIDPRVNPGELFGGVLTARQREVLQLIAEGKSAKEMASILGISVKTVEFHKAAIVDELGLRSSAELTRYAIECGIVA